MSSGDLKHVLNTNRPRRPDGSLHREGRHQVRGPVQGNATDSPPSDDVWTKLDRIGALAEQMPQTALRSLNHCLDSQLMWVAYTLTRRDAAAGVDGETYEDFQIGLFESSTSSLIRLTRARTGLPRCVGCTSRKGRGRKPVRWASQRSQTKCCSVP